VRESLAIWGLRKIADTAEQIADELASNALSHSRGESPIVLLLMYAAGTMRLEVRDEDLLNLPIMRKPQPADESGRGLLIVESLSHRWGTRVTDVGKSVWAEVDIAGREITRSTRESVLRREARA
jgi:hypothetical protein